MEDPAARAGLSYDPEADLHARYPGWVAAAVPLGWGIREVLSLRRRVVLVEARAPAEQRRCSLAHAVAHLDLGHAPVPAGDFELRQERAADLLAASRLVPAAALADALDWCSDTAELAGVLEVDESLLELRLRTLPDPERRRIESRLRFRPWAA